MGVNVFERNREISLRTNEEDKISGYGQLLFMHFYYGWDCWDQQISSRRELLKYVLPYSSIGMQ